MQIYSLTKANMHLSRYVLARIITTEVPINVLYTFLSFKPDYIGRDANVTFRRNNNYFNDINIIIKLTFNRLYTISIYVTCPVNANKY